MYLLQLHGECEKKIGNDILYPYPTSPKKAIPKGRKHGLFLR